MLSRRAWMHALAWSASVASSRVAHAQPSAVAAVAPAASDPVRRGRPIVFPRDHGAHLGQRIEWWYVTGWLGADAHAPTHGFQVTFFRLRTGLADTLDSRFAPRHLLMAHAAVTDLAAARHRHTQRLARWSGDAADASLRARAAIDDAHVSIAPWQLRRVAADGPSTWLASVDHGDASTGWSLDLEMSATQPPLLQGDTGFSRKGATDAHATHYVTEPHLATRARLRIDGRVLEREGRAWLDHEWSDTLVPDDAVGWDWIGMNLDDGSALTAFRLRRADGTSAWVGGSLRRASGATRVFDAQDIRFEPARRWRSPATGGDYPVQWMVHTPVGRFEVRSLLDAQELDARASTGTVYWEGLASLHDERGQRVGHGYLEMTGYVGRVRF